MAKLYLTGRCVHVARNETVAEDDVSLPVHELVKNSIVKFDFERRRKVGGVCINYLLSVVKIASRHLVPLRNFKYRVHYAEGFRSIQSSYDTRKDGC
jgi:hypothetical protein